MGKIAVNDELNDRQLIARFNRSRDEEAFAALVARHGPMVLRVCRRILKNEQDAEDVLQAVFLLLARKSRQVRWHSCVGNWLYGVASRIALQESRRMRKHPEQRLVNATELACPDEDNLESNEPERELYQVLNNLPNKYRAPVVLCHLEGKTRRQAAEELGVNESTVKGRLERGRDMLRRKLAKRGLAIPAALFSGELARQIADAAISNAMTISTAQAAAKFAVGYSVATASANAAVALAKGELAKMLVITQIKCAVVTISAVAAFGTGAVVISQNTKGENSTSNGVVAVRTDAEKASAPSIASPDDTLIALADDDSPKESPKESPNKSAEKKLPELNPGAVSHSLKILGRAMHNYHAAVGAFPTAANYDANQKKLLSWRVHVLPFLDQQNLYNQFRLNEAWDSKHNKRLIEKMPKVFAAKSKTLEKSGKTVFLVPIGKGTAFGSRDPIRIQDITDGTSNTIMVVTVKPKHAVEWTRPADWEMNKKKPFEKLTGKQGKGFMCGLCDGSSHNLSKPLTVEKLKALLTRNGGEIVVF